MTCLLCILLYEMFLFVAYSPGQSNYRSKPEDKADVSVPSPTDDAIIGKSSFNVDAEIKKMRERKDEAERKAAIAKGEMTEDGKEIAQEVTMDDCEVEQKKVIVPVPSEELEKVLPLEDDEPVEGYAIGNPINDLDLSLKVAKEDDPDEQEEYHASEVLYRFLADTEVLDEICNLAPEEGKRICRMIDRYKKEMSKDAEKPTAVPSEDTKVDSLSNTGVILKRFTMAERYAGFGIEDAV